MQNSPSVFAIQHQISDIVYWLIAGCITQINYVYTLPTVGCGDVFTDPGGASNDYCPNADPSNTNWLICPDVPGDVVTLTFTSFDVEGTFTCWDEIERS